MNNNALILYASSTGNTGKIAARFSEVLGSYGWNCSAVHLENSTDLTRQSVHLDDYDLVLLGSPVISSGVSPIVSRNLALVGVEPPRLYSNQMIFPGSFFRPEHSPLGVVFATYSGETYGPCEALSTLEQETMYLQYLFIDVIGRFACPGRKESKTTIDLIATELKLEPSQTAQLIGKYERNPSDSCFAALTEDALALLHQATLDKQQTVLPQIPDGFSTDGWHHDMQNRPSSRDLLKAEIFLSEILEDYFTEDGLPKRARSVYQCIG